ncbi:hypothetical protein [Stenotrophomonas rhizophila]
MDKSLKSSYLYTAILATAAVALAVLPSTTQARSKADDAFFQAAGDADFRCGLASGSYALAKEYRASSLATDGEKVTTCLVEGRSSMLEALKAIPNDDANKALRDAAKKVYSAWGPYSGFLSQGVSFRQVEASPVTREFKQALSEYGTELELAN